jgi:signal recognition particle GTPase
LVRRGCVHFGAIILKKSQQHLRRRSVKSSHQDALTPAQKFVKIVAQRIVARLKASDATSSEAPGRDFDSKVSQPIES